MKSGFYTALFLLGCVVLFAVGYWLNLPGVHDLATTLQDGFGQLWHILIMGVSILFFCLLFVGGALAYVEVRKRARVIAPTRYGPVQAVMHKGELVPLASPTQAQMDPLQQLAMLKTVMQLQGQMQKLAQQTTVQEAAPLEIEAPSEHIPAIVRYSDVQDDVPDNMSLLGIHPSNGELELSDWEKLKMLWIIGSSSTGKSNTVFGKALEAYNHHAKLLVVDQHAVKPDSLARKLAPLKDAFLRPIAQTDDQVLATLQAFKTEFERRVSGASCAQKIVLIMDEINRMARNEALLAAIKEVVAIGGEESRGFGMYVWCISQKAVHLKWLRDSAITVIAHRVTRMEEAKLACNDDLKAARKLLTFPVGRSFVYGVDFDDLLELQQPLYDVPDVIESTLEPPSENFQARQWEGNEEAPGSAQNDDTSISDLRTIKKLREIGKQLKAGKSRAEIVKSFGLPYGRATQEMSAVVDMVAEQIEAEG